MRVLTLFIAAFIIFSPCTKKAHEYPLADNTQQNEAAVSKAHPLPNEYVLTAKKTSCKEKITFFQFYISKTPCSILLSDIKSQKSLSLKELPSIVNEYISFIEFFQTLT